MVLETTLDIFSTACCFGLWWNLVLSRWLVPAAVTVVVEAGVCPALVDAALLVEGGGEKRPDVTW